MDRVAEAVEESEDEDEVGMFLINVEKEKKKKFFFFLLIIKDDGLHL